MDMIGKVLSNRYEILEKIGSGGMATVYKAKCRVLNRFVAIKILKDEFANDAEFIKRFQVEAQSAASLSHQNIVSIFDVSEDEGQHYIVMELIEGKTLKEIINEKGALPWRDSVKIVAQIAAGLNQAHKNHIIHRDIKPHNIIITKDGIAKVTDFGIAKAVSNSTINAFGSTIGSVHYFSPEHARGGYTDEKSDIYSLGVVLYEMCTGKLPFDAETPVSVALKHLQEKPKEPMEINNEIPSGLNAIIMKAMQKEIGNRYPSAIDMYNDLMKLLKYPDDVTLGALSKDIEVETEFPTQRIPVIGTHITKDEDNEDNNKRKQDVEYMSSKKGITKRQAIVKLFVYIVAIIVLFLLCIKIGQNALVFFIGRENDVSVPNIVGYSFEEAEKTLRELGLEIEVQANVSSSEYPEGYVIYQEKKEGYTLKKGTKVGVKLSKGENKILVPDVSTLSSTTAAEMKVETAGLVYKEEYEYHDTIPSGDIIRQDPKVNEEIEKGSEVKVYVSMGPASGDTGLVKIPDVLDYTEEDARITLDAALLVPKVTYTESKTKKDGVVISQYPEKDTYQPQLTEVTLVVNRLTGGGNTSSGDGTKPTTPTNPITKRKVTIDLSKMGERETFNVKVVVEGISVGKRIEYEKQHSRTDGTIEVEVTNAVGAMLKVYVDDVVVSEMTL